MATYYKKEEPTPVKRTVTAGEGSRTEYSIKCEAGQLEIPEKYIRAMVQVEMISNMVTEYMKLGQDHMPCDLLLFLLGRDEK